MLCIPMLAEAQPDFRKTFSMGSSPLNPNRYAWTNEGLGFQDTLYAPAYTNGFMFVDSRGYAYRYTMDSLRNDVLIFAPKTDSTVFATVYRVDTAKRNIRTEITNAAGKTDTVSTIELLQLYTGNANTLFVTDQKRGGLFIPYSGTLDSGMTFGGVNNSWQRLYSAGDPIKAEWFNVGSGKNPFDNARWSNKALVAANTRSKWVVFNPNDSFSVASRIYVSPDMDDMFIQYPTLSIALRPDSPTIRPYLTPAIYVAAGADRVHIDRVNILNGYGSHIAPAPNGTSYPDRQTMIYFGETDGGTVTRSKGFNILKNLAECDTCTNFTALNNVGDSVDRDVISLVMAGGRGREGVGMSNVSGNLGKRSSLRGTVEIADMSRNVIADNNRCENCSYAVALQGHSEYTAYGMENITVNNSSCDTCYRVVQIATHVWLANMSWNKNFTIDGVTGSNMKNSDGDKAEAFLIDGVQAYVDGLKIRNAKYLGGDSSATKMRISHCRNVDIEADLKYYKIKANGYGVRFNDIDGLTIKLRMDSGYIASSSRAHAFFERVRNLKLTGSVIKGNGSQARGVIINDCENAYVAGNTIEGFDVTSGYGLQITGGTGNDSAGTYAFNDVRGTRGINVGNDVKGLKLIYNEGVENVSNWTGKTSLKGSNADTTAHIFTGQVRFNSVNDTVGSNFSVLVREGNIVKRIVKDSAMAKLGGLSAASANALISAAIQTWVDTQGVVPDAFITKIKAGNGMNFPTVGADSATIILGTPSSVGVSTSNTVTTNSHTHQLNLGGTSSQVLRGNTTFGTYWDFNGTGFPYFTSGVLSFNDLSAYSQKTASIKTVSATSYTLLAADVGRTLRFTSNSNITVTVPAGLGEGYNVMLIQYGNGQITVTPSSTTINNPDSYTKSAKKWATISLIATEADVFVSAGNMTN